MLHVIILAAGLGHRMGTGISKVLHKLAGKPLLEHVLHTAEQLNPERLYVVYSDEAIPQLFPHLKKVHWILQQPILGTAHAVMQVLPHLPMEGQVLILLGDIPLITVNTLHQLLKQTDSQALGLITAFLSKPQGYGRILRDTQKRIIGTVEEQDATLLQQQIHEINAGLYLAPAAKLRAWLPQLTNNNCQKEYYLPDIIPLAINTNTPISCLAIQDSHEIQGINTRRQLAALEHYYQTQQAQTLLDQGLGLLDPEHFCLRGSLHFGRDIVIDSHVLLEGDVQIGDEVVIGPFNVLRNVRLASNIIIESHCVIENCTIGPGCIIGPFARLRPGTQLNAHVQIGNFVELKNSYVDAESKINHLSYIGDATIGHKVNIGAGTITCNYDGSQKHRTQIEDGVSVGANTTLIAPITLQSGSTTGAGSTLTRDAPKDSLTYSRAKQRSLKNWRLRWSKK